MELSEAKMPVTGKEGLASFVVSILTLQDTTAVGGMMVLSDVTA